MKRPNAGFALSASTGRGGSNRPMPAGQGATRLIAGGAEQEPTLQVVAARVASRLSPEQHWRFEARKEWALAAVPLLKTVDELRATATAAEMRAIVAVFGSIPTMHQTVVQWFEREAIFPWPAESYVYPDGRIEHRW